MKIFVDDLRKVPEELNYICVKSYEGCVALLKARKDEIDVINLDYDLSSEKTGLDILKFMKENDIHPKRIIIHSSDVPKGNSDDREYGAMLMDKYVRENFKDCHYTFAPSND